MRNPFGLVSLLVSVFLAASGLRATTFVPPLNFADLARQSDAVVLGEAVSSEVVERGALLFTRTAFVVQERVFGSSGPGAVVVVETPGGELKGRAWTVPGAPNFQPGHRYFLCLRAKSESLWTPLLLACGILEEVAGVGGEALLVPVPELGLGEALPRSDGRLVEPITPYYKEGLLGHLGEVLEEGASWNAALIRATPEAAPSPGTGGATPDGCVFIPNRGRSSRWRIFDSGETATIFSDAAGDPSLSGNTFKSVVEAINILHDIPQTSLGLVYGGPIEPTFNCQQGVQSNTILFDDPCAEIPDLEGCSGILAFGGPLTSGTHNFDGTRWATIDGWIVVVNNGSGCLGERNYRRMLAHELGHGLGFAHVMDPEALMFQSCCNGPNATDILCSQFAYPALDSENSRPVVDLGPGHALVLARNTARLSAAVSDDGRPAVPGALTTLWHKVDGPGDVTFEDDSALETAVAFSSSGTYVLGLTASDGQLLRTGSIQLEVELWVGSALKVTFQHGLDYEGTVDTFLQENAEAADNSQALRLSIDLDDPVGSQMRTQGLLRFDEIFGLAEEQVPVGASILSAELQLRTEDPGDGASFYRMAVPWTDQDSWSTFGGDGIQPGIETQTEPDVLVDGGGGYRRVDMTTSLAAWARSPCSNHGWALLPHIDGEDGWDFFSAEGSDPPRLSVRYWISQDSSVIDEGAEWRLFRGSSPVPATWFEESFDDSEWEQGPSGIGYGNGDDETVLEDMRFAYLAAFFRKTFSAEGLEDFDELFLTIIHGGGVVAYLNGSEIGRFNMPPGPATESTAATLPRVVVATELRIPRELVQQGSNQLAISVHNDAVDSQNFSFAPVLVPVKHGTRMVNCDAGFQRGDATGDGRVNISDAIVTLGFLFQGATRPECLDAADANDDGRVDISDPIGVVEHLFQGRGPLPPPAVCGPDPTPDPILDSSTPFCAG